MSAHLYDEGHTVAGWAGFGIATVGAAVAGLGVCTASGAMVGGGVAVVAVSVLVTWVLHLAGWGKPPGRRPREQWGLRVRDTQARQGHPGCVGCRLAGRAPSGGRRTVRAPSGGRRTVVEESAAEPTGGSAEPVA